MYGSLKGGVIAALAGATLLNQTDLAGAHAVAGNRFFPATLGIDDPGANDELALPTFTYIPLNGDGALEYNVSFAYAKRITNDLALSVSDTYTRLKPGGFGFQNVGVGAKYQVIVSAEHEFIASIGVDSEIGGTGAVRVGADPFSTIRPTAYFGKGFGDLPGRLDLLRPFAITGQIDYAIPTRGSTSTVAVSVDTGGSVVTTQHNATALSYGATLQYSLPYFNANVREIRGPDFLKRLIPLVEVSLSTPVANTTAGQRKTTGNVQPGIVYAADTYQIAVEALIPINEASGRRVGVVGELHFFLDDIFPNSLGRPIFK